MTRKETRDAEYWGLRVAPTNTKTTIAEALVALRMLETAAPRWERDLCATIRSVLTDAAAEAECWRVIEGWVSEDGKYRRPVLGQVFGSDDWFSELARSDAMGLTQCFNRPTRQLALQAACDWIKKEGTK